MGPMFDQVSFVGRAPDLTSIAERVTALCGLRVILKRSDREDNEILYDQHGSMAFACSPQEAITVFTYKPGAVRKSFTDLTDGVELPLSPHVLGLDEPDGIQAVHLEGYVGLETLMAVTLLALESLGGKPRKPISEECRREYERTITEGELLKRRRQTNRRLWKLGILYLLLLPVTFPLFMLHLLVQLFTLPARIEKAEKLTKEALSNRDHKKLLECVPDEMDFVVTNVSEHAALDIQAVEQYSEALQALGFMWAVDYTVRYPRRPMHAQVGPAFARLWPHPSHVCVAEVNQMLGKD
jgi:hypothetical protein